jgi:hypothetical protein
VAGLQAYSLEEILAEKPRAIPHRVDKLAKPCMNREIRVWF